MWNSFIQQHRYIGLSLPYVCLSVCLYVCLLWPFLWQNIYYNIPNIMTCAAIPETLNCYFKYDLWARIFVPTDLNPPLL